MVELQDITKKDDLNYQSKRSKIPIVFNGYK